MDNGDLASGSGSGPDMRKKLKSDDSVNDSVNDCEDDSVSDCEDDCENDCEGDFEDDCEEDFEDDCEEDEEMEEDNLPSTAEKVKDSHNAMAKWFMSSGINPNTIKTASFAKFMRLMNPNLPLSASLVEKEVLEIHEECREKAKKFLKDFQGKLTLSYEWLLLRSSEFIKGPILHEDFVCMTAHFIDDNWKVRKWILGYTTDQSIPLDDIYVHHFRTAVQGFEIESKVSTILLPCHEDFDEKTVDAIRKCIEEKGNSSIIPPVFVVHCCADLFRLMADDMYSALRWGMYEELRMLVGWGRCLSEPTWNVTLHHLQLAVDMKNEDAFSKDEIYDDYDKPSDEEWIQIQTFCKLGGCIYKVAKELFEEGYTTSNVYFHLLAELKVMLNQELVGADSDYFLRKARTMLKMFDKYWNDMFLVLAIASVLDPRFKMKYIEFYCSKKIDNDEGGSKAETVLDYLRNLYARYAASEICQKPICPVATIDSEEEEEDDDEEEEDYYGEGEEGEREAQKAKEEEKKKPDAYEGFVLFQEFLKFEGSARVLEESELDSYLKEPVLEWSKDFIALEWWKEESQKYPILSRVARDILSIPISRATSYEAYVTDKREPPEFVLSMEPKVANAMMCGKSWLRL
ncbi:unnamed protein product [Thlaspi arvense]|uniref:Zinc finger BED domain-containing protein RICESLEEPER 2-like n=1 Tax=Thlaspi arvense TaxID=13288 RepID=A0AAU9RY77_THLAR|nr:unnamed protein product [Thlaspi arvense]